MKTLGRRVTRWRRAPEVVLLSAGLLWCSVAVFALPALASSFASSFPPCAPTAEIPPSLQITDTTQGGTRLTATHPIQVVWSDRNSEASLILDSYRVSAPFTMVPYDNVANFIPPSAGHFSFGLTWHQQQFRGPANDCMGSLSRALTVGAAVRPRFSRVHFAFGGPRDDRVTELSWTLKTGGSRLNLGLVTAELRAVGRDRLPGSHTPKHTLRFPLCDCDPLFGHIHNPRVVRVGPVQMTTSTEIGIRFLLDIRVSTTHATRFGYDLLVRQGTHRLGRLRAAGTCHFMSGFSNCKVDHFPRPEK
jgi:hypothetical protein